ncbi:MAG: hypothetical protein JJE53_01300 [Candidatus Pacebacteria bacterium]|nr:hypothetical protein [Candidatus Paceibacterota bacterium]
MVSFFKDNTVYLLISLLWVLPWKGYALWTAARTRNKKWFIALLLINTFAILDIIYIFYIAKKTKKDIKRIVDSVF